MRYALITPAHNEERFIAKTLESMVALSRWFSYLAAISRGLSGHKTTD